MNSQKPCVEAGASSAGLGTGEGGGDSTLANPISHFSSSQDTADFPSSMIISLPLLNNQFDGKAVFGVNKRINKLV